MRKPNKMKIATTATGALCMISAVSLGLNLNASETITADDVNSEILNINASSDDPNQVENEIEKYTQSIENEVVNKDTKVVNDTSGVGNQNKSDIGKAGFVYADEAQEDEFKSLDTIASSNDKLIPVTDLNQDLVSTAANKANITEGIVPLSTSEANSLGLSQTVSFTDGSSSAWSNKTDNASMAQATLKKPVVSGSAPKMTVKNYGLYYDIDSLEYTPINVEYSIDFMDFWNGESSVVSPSTFMISYNKGTSSVALNDNHTDEIQISIKMVNSKTGEEIDAPVIYKLTDIDMQSSLTFKESDIKSYAAYYVNKNDSANANLGDYNDSNYHWDGTKPSAVWNYESFYNWALDRYKDGTSTLPQFRTGTRYYKANDTMESMKATYVDEREQNYAGTKLASRAKGNFSGRERGWNRLKYFERNGYLTIGDTWGSNSNGVNDEKTGEIMTTDGKDSELAMVINSNTTFLMNFSNGLFNYPVDGFGASQVLSIRPYEFKGQAFIDKESKDENGNGVVEDGEDINYAITLTNTDPMDTITNAPVRDSLLENMPSWLTLSNVKATGTQYNLDGSVAGTYDVATTGDLTKGTFKVNSIKPRSKVVIEYTLTMSESKPSDTNRVENVVVNTNTDPEGACKPTDNDLDCAATIVPIEPDTTVKKSVTESDKDGFVVQDETLTYTIYVTNSDKDYDSYNVPVTDTLLESLPAGVKFNNDVTVSGSGFTGSLTDGTFVLNKVPKDSTVTITYSITALEDIDQEITPNIINKACTPSYDTESCDTTTTPVQPEGTAKISKSMVGNIDDGIVTQGEKLNYTITVTNPDRGDANDVPVKDTLVENTPAYLTFNNDIKVTGNNNTYTGSLQDGTMVLDKVKRENEVKITYSMTAKETLTPTDTEYVTNTACVYADDEDEDCDNTKTPVNGITEVSKAVTEANKDGVVTQGEKLNYTISVTNPYKNNDAYDVPVTDTLVENTPAYLTFNNDVVVSGNSNTYKGNLKDGDMILDKVAKGETVKITYSMTAKETLTPTDTEYVTNKVCVYEGDTSDEDCDNTKTPVNGIAKVSKSMTDAVNDGYVSQGEKLNYTISVTNPYTNNDALYVPVTDTLVENTPAYLTFNNDVVVSGNSNTYKGNLQDGTMVLDKVAKGETVKITYSMTAASDLTPEDTEYVTNTACTYEDGDKDQTCDDESEIVNALTNIDKKMVDENGDGYVDAGEKLTYTISVTNPYKNPAQDVHVRDSLLENLPSYLTYNDDMVVEGDSNVYTGDLVEGNFMLDVVNPSKTVTITYSVTAADDLTPLINGEGDGANYIENIATDNGQDPIDACDEDTESEDCAQTIEPVNAPLEIDKTAVVPESESGTLGKNQRLNFDVHLTNKYDMPANNAHVRDTLLEDTPDYLVDQYDDKISSETQEKIITSGDLRNADYMIEQIDPKTEADITYSMLRSNNVDIDHTIQTVNNTVCENNNAMTDGLDDKFTDEELITDTNCDNTVTPIEPDTTIQKELIDGSDDGIIQDGELLNYQITIVNDSKVTAHNIAVRDSLIETIANGDAPYLTYNYEDTEVVGNRFDVKTEGELYNNDFVIEEIPAKSSVVINYTITAGDIPDTVTSIANIVTDNGNEPNTCELKPETEEDSETSEVDSDIIPKNSRFLENEGAGNTLRPIGDIETLTPEVDVINYQTEDCDQAELPVEPETTIEKSVTDANENFVLEDGELLNYQITLTNDSTLPVKNVPVRDSMLEETPEYLSLVEDSIKVTSKTAKDEIKTTGDLTEGTFTIKEVPAKSNVVITYQMQAVEPLPEDIKMIDNIVTDTGADPDVCVNPDGSDAVDTDRDENKNANDEISSEVSSETDSEVSSETNSEVTSEEDERDFTGITPLALESNVTTNEDSEITNEESEANNEAIGSNHIDNLTGMESIKDPINQKDIDCDIATVPVEGETLISKTLTDASENNVAEIGEDLNYEITVVNPNTLPVYSTPIRDSLLENLPEYVTLGDIKVTSKSKDGDVKTQGDLTEGTFTIDEIAPKGQVQINYTLTLNAIPEDASGLINIVTDTGLEPDVCEDADKEIDCDQAVIPFETETLIEKTVMDDNNNGLAEIDEPLHYTITVKNDTDVEITGTNVRDSLLENLPKYLTFDESVLNIEADFDVETEGSLIDGTFTIVSIPAHEEVEITYDLVPTGDLAELPVINNIVTDNGEEPTVCEEADNGIDCDDASVAPAVPEEETPVLPNTGV